MLVGGGVAAACIVLFSFLVMPGIEKIRSNGRALRQAELDLSELRTSIPEIRNLEGGMASRKALIQAGGNAGDSPLSRLTALVQDSGLPQASFSIKSGGVKEGEFFKEESFDLKVENRSYLEMVRLIQRLEGAPVPLAVRSVNLKSRYENSSAIDAIIRIGYLLPR